MLKEKKNNIFLRNLIMKRIMYIMLLLCAIPLTQAQAVIVTPGNLVMPASAGELFSFDFIITDIGDLTREAQGFQAIISVSGPGVLTGDEAGSMAVSSVSAYWLFENSSPVFIDHLDDSYTFGDNPENGLPQALATNDIMARYAFIWGGTVGWYTFTLDLDTINSFILLEDFFSKEALQFSPGSYPSDNPIDSFKVYIPEPATIILLALGGTVLLRKRMRKLS